MSNAKHTPGPWVVHDRWYIGTPGEGMRTHAEVKCCVNVPASDHEQHEANACLIAAAPDLLAACEAVVEQDGFVGSALMRKRIEEMKAAIAKAKGG